MSSGGLKTIIGSLLIRLEIVRIIPIFSLELFSEHLLELFLGDDLSLIVDDALLSGLLHILVIRVVVPDPEALDVAAGDLAAVVVLVVAKLFVDCHGAAIDCLATIQSGLPGCLVVPSITRGVVDNGVDVTHLARPGVHLPVWLVVRIPGGLRGPAVSVVESVLLD